MFFFGCFFYQLTVFNISLSPPLSLRWWTRSVLFPAEARTSCHLRRWRNNECESGWSVSAELRKYAGSVDHCSYTQKKLKWELQKSLRDVLLYCFFSSIKATGNNRTGTQGAWRTGEPLPGAAETWDGETEAGTGAFGEGAAREREGSDRAGAVSQNTPTFHNGRWKL